MTEHVMLDLETWGTGPYAAIWTIGAVKFNPNHLAETEQELLDMTERFEARCDMKTSTGIGLRIDVDTVQWWMSPDRHDAREAILAMEPQDIRNVLEEFRAWFGEPKPVWGNGAMFDNMIMTNAFKLANVECPWSYRHDRCYRTFKSLWPDFKQPTYGLAHGALDDAMAQAWGLQRAVRGMSWEAR
jgi:hypothetical protein